MKTLKKYILILVCLTLLLSLASCQKGELSFSSDDGKMNYSLSGFTGEDVRTFEGEKGIELEVRIEKSGGELDIRISGENGEKVYVSNDADSGAFYLTLPSDCNYEIAISSKKATAEINIRYVEKTIAD